MPPEGFPFQASKGISVLLGGFSFDLSQTPGGLFMNTERAKRKLSAILSADVKGYSRLMGEDEVATVRTLKEYRELMSKLIKEYRGRVVDSPGDNVLAEFVSVVDSLECSIEIQKVLKSKNAALPDNRRMEFRIGVNLGDVIEDEDRLYGDGVNIAARIEGLAEPGGICISASGFEQVRNKLPLGYEYLGEHTVKNIVQPIKVYRVLMEPEAAGKVIGEKDPKQRRWRWKSAAVAVLVLVAGGLLLNLYWRIPKIEPASKEKMAFPLPEVPSIAVLPFVNMSEDPKQEFLCDGMTEEIITGLSKVPRLFVIARSSTSFYKGKPVKIKQVSEELGVRYVLEGSVRRSGDRVRITAQLIDALTGNHLWAESYDRDLTDLFALQDEITIKVLGSTKAKLTEGGQVGRAEKYFKGKQGLDCYLKLTEASGYHQRWNIEDNNLARRMIEESIAMCPETPMGYIELAWVYHHDYWLGNTKSPRKTIEEGIELAQKALAMDDSIGEGHAVLSSLYLARREYDKAIAEGERAVALNPGGTLALVNYANSLAHAGKPEEAVPAFQKAIRLNPFGPSGLYREFGNALRDTSRFEEAISAYKKAIQLAPDNILAHINLALTYILVGREKEARAEAAEVLRINPKFSLEVWAKTRSYEDQSQTDKVINALRKAGLPDKPPLPLPDKPSIAVLPFVNISDDKSQEYLADGITENIISALSQVPNLLVIARNSTFTYKGKPVKVQQVAEALGVLYVLEGSVQKSGDTLRITAQLIDAITGQQMWSERYNRELKNIFALQDDITMKVITALQVKLTVGEGARLLARGTKNLEAYLKYLQASAVFNTQSKEGYAQARRLYEEVIAMDPQYAAAYGALGAFHAMEAVQGLSKSPGESLNQALELTKKAIAIDESDAVSHSRLGWLYVLVGRQYDKAIAECERGIDLAPNSAECHIWMAYVLTYAGRSEEAVRYAEQALRFNPYPPSWWIRQLGQSYFFAGQYEEAIAAHKKSLNLSPKDLLTHLHLTTAYSWAGRHEEALAQAAEILRINPKFSVEERAKFMPLKNQADLDRYLDGLRKAGLK
jgi:adenylate cyclase